MKRNAITFIFSMLVAVAFGQSNFGKDYFALGEYKLAKTWFEQQVSQSPAESNYYLGEIAWKEGNADAAKEYYEKGIAADPLYMLNYVGKGKTLLKSNQKEAEMLFMTALKKNKKDVPTNLAVVAAYKDNGMNDIAQLKLAQAEKIGKKAAALYIYEGDQILAGNSESKLGDASSKYEQAMYFEPGNTVAQIKYAQVYNQINPKVSVETLKKVIAAHPDYLIAYRDIAVSYFKDGFYPQAIDNFKTYFANGSYNVEDLWRFASAYYFTNQYDESLKLINEGLQINPDHFVLNRLRMYNASKMKDTQNGMAYATKFFSLRPEGEESKFIYQDYLAYANILADSSYFDKALEQFNKVLNTEDEKVDQPTVYKDMGECYNKMKDYAKAADCFQKYISMVGVDYVESSAYFELGKAYYGAAQSIRKDPSQKDKLIEYVTLADSAFTSTIRMAPDSYVGYMWRANTYTLLDPESTQGLAKPYFEEAVTVILKKASESQLSPSLKKQLLSAYQYLGYYYYLKEDKVNSSLYWNKILELDPTDKNAIMVLDSYKAEAEKKK